MNFSLIRMAFFTCLRRVYVDFFLTSASYRINDLSDYESFI